MPAHDVSRFKATTESAMAGSSPAKLAQPNRLYVDTGEEEPNLCEHRESANNKFRKGQGRQAARFRGKARVSPGPQKRRANVVRHYLPKVDTNC